VGLSQILTGSCFSRNELKLGLKLLDTYIYLQLKFQTFIPLSAGQTKAGPLMIVAGKTKN